MPKILSFLCNFCQFFEIHSFSRDFCRFIPLPPKFLLWKTLHTLIIQWFLNTIDVVWNWLQDWGLSGVKSLVQAMVFSLYGQSLGPLQIVLVDCYSRCAMKVQFLGFKNNCERPWKYDLMDINLGTPKISLIAKVYCILIKKLSPIFRPSLLPKASRLQYLKSPSPLVHDRYLSKWINKIWWPVPANHHFWVPIYRELMNLILLLLP